MEKNNGIVTKEKDGYCVRFERTLNHSIDAVWDAITNPEKLKIWFTDFTMDFVTGGKMIIYFRDEAKTASVGKIIRIDPPYFFQWSWEDELATWELTRLSDKQCKLVLTYSKLPDTYAISVPAGWHILLDQLETVLGGHTTPYPFGGSETAEGEAMKKMYRDLLQNQFPELNK